MKLLYKEEHLVCTNYDIGPRPIIEVKDINKKNPFSGLSNISKIVFILEGDLHFSCGAFPQIGIDTGKMLFIPPNKQFTLKTEGQAKILIIRISQILRFCECYLIESLLHQTRDTIIQAKPNHGIFFMPINEVISLYISGLRLAVEQDVRCKYYFETKIKELFYLFRNFYTKEELSMFFREILNTDPYFFYFVKYNYRNYKTASEFASDMNMTLQSFEKRFKSVFNTPAYRWMKEQKVSDIHQAICTEDTPLKELAVRFGFSSKSSFSDFCKKNMGVSPGQIREKMYFNKNDEQKKQNA